VAGADVVAADDDLVEADQIERRERRKRRHQAVWLGRAAGQGRQAGDHGRCHAPFGADEPQPRAAARAAGRIGFGSL
jgi:hypothetical protein